MWTGLLKCILCKLGGCFPVLLLLLVIPIIVLTNMKQTITIFVWHIYGSVSQIYFTVGCLFLFCQVGESTWSRSEWKGRFDCKFWSFNCCQHIYRNHQLHCYHFLLLGIEIFCHITIWLYVHVIRSSVLRSMWIY